MKLRKLTLDAPLRGLELMAISREIDELRAIVDDDNASDDAYDSALDRLDELVEYLEKSMKICQTRERGMKAV